MKMLTLDMAHTARHALSLVSFILRGIGNDNRPKQ